MSFSLDKGMMNKKDLRRLYWRSCQLDLAWNYERQQNLGYSYGIVRALEKVYENNPEKLAPALKRSLEFMACTPQVVPLLMGINIALEEENMKNDVFEPSVITSIKTSLMGPMAAIGDSLIPGTLRIIAAGIGVSLSMEGNILGPILFLLVFNIPSYIIRYFSLKFGYSLGSDLIKNMAKTNVMDKISYYASVVGLMVIGGMIFQQIWLDLPLVVGSGDFAKPLVEFLDEIMPGLVQLGLFGTMYYFVGKKVKTTTLLWIILLLGVAVALLFSLI